MSRRKEILESQFVDGEWEELMDNLNTDISPSVYLAMEKYARECCEATLRKASDTAEWGVYQNDDGQEPFHHESNIFIHRNTIDNEDNITFIQGSE